MFEHLQIDNRFERRFVGAVDLVLAPWAAINAWRQPAADDELPPKRVLLFRLERIGDLLMTLGAINAIRARLLDAELRLVVGSWNAPLAHCMPAVDAVETFDVPWLSREQPGSTLRAATAQSAAWRGQGYDLAINFEPDIRSNALVAASGARRRIGYASGGGGGFLTDVARLRPDDPLGSERATPGGPHPAGRAVSTVCRLVEPSPVADSLGGPPDGDAPAGRA